MYGVPKFREGVFLKFKKEIVLSVCALLTIATVVEFAPGHTVATTSQPTAVVLQQSAQTNSYKVIYDGKEMGIVESEEDATVAQEEALKQLIAKLGYNPEVVPKVSLTSIHSEKGTQYLDMATLTDKFFQAYYDGLTVIKQPGYVMKIGSDFTVALKSEADIKEVLKRAQSHYISDNRTVEITLAKDEHNSMVILPQVLMLDEESRNFATAGSDQKVPGGNDASGSESTDTQATDSANTDKNGDIETGTPEVTLDVDFADQIMIVQTYVDPAELKDVDSATELITKENEAATKYVVQAGDSASKIAADNDMGLSDLYDLNPELKAKEFDLKIGDEVVVMVPEPELSISTKVEITYTEAIDFEVSKVDDTDIYVGSQEVRQEGKEGVMEVTATVTKLNGQEVSREVTNQKVVEEAVTKIVAVGKKPLPVKKATGDFMYPTTNFMITSPFGWRSRGFHTGVDFATHTGTKIVAADGGTVLFAGWKDSGYGYCVDIDHGKGVVTRYAHCSKVSVSAGQQVAKGQEIARVGSTGNSTGPHVHFEVRIDDEPVNPMKYLD